MLFLDRRYCLELFALEHDVRAAPFIGARGLVVDRQIKQLRPSLPQGVAFVNFWLFGSCLELVELLVKRIHSLVLSGLGLLEHRTSPLILSQV